MPIYQIMGRNGKLYEIEGPPGVTKEQIKAKILQRAPEAAIPPQEKSPIEDIPLVGGALSGLADIPLSAVQGLTGTAKTFTDIFGANNRASRGLDYITQAAAALKSAGSKEDAALAAKIQKDAEGKGLWEEVKAAAKSFGLSPIETTASVLGSAVPFIAAGALAPEGAAAYAAMAGTGALSGIGMIKGDIYDAVLEEFTKAGVPPEKAQAAAEKAQEYGGKNMDQQMLGAALGALASSTGVAPALARRIGMGTAEQAVEKAAARAAAREAAGEAAKKTPGLVRTALTGAAAEAIPEAAQAGQERYAQNVALQREGVDVDPMAGVAGQAAFEGIASLIPGAGGKVYETIPEYKREAAKQALMADAEQARAAVANPQATDDEKQAAVRALADRFVATGLFPEDEALAAAEDIRRREEARIQAEKDAKAAPKTKEAVATPVDEIPEPTVRQKEAARAEEMQAEGVGGADSGPDVDVTGAAGPSVSGVSSAAPTGETAKAPAPSESVGVAGTGEPVGGAAPAETSTDGTLTPETYVDRYLAGEGRGGTPADLELQQYAANNGPAIEAEFARRLAAPTTEAPSAVEEGTAPKAAQEKPAQPEAKGEEPTPAPAPVEVGSEVEQLQRFVDENNPGYEVRYNPELKTRPWSIGLPGGKLLARSVSANGLRKTIMKQPKIGPRETVEGVEVKRYPTAQPKPAKTKPDIFSRDAVDPDDIAGGLNEAQQEQVALLIGEIDKTRADRGITNAERTELVRMLEDTQEVISPATNRPVTTTGRNKDFVWNVINFTQKKLDTLRKEGRKLRGRQEGVGKDIFEKGTKLTSEERALKEEIKANAAEMKKQAAVLLEQKRIVYERVRKRMAEMKQDRADKIAALKADYAAGKLNKGRYERALSQLRPEKILYRSGKRDVAGIALDSMRTVVNAITSRWNANVNVKMVQSVNDLPETVRQQMEKDDRLDAYGFLRGNDVYLIADNMDSLEDVAPTLFHEVLGHVGLRRAFREALDDVLNEIYRTNAKVREAVDQWKALNGNLYAGDEDPLARAVEEVLATASEDGPLVPSKLDKLVRFVRNAVRKLFGFPLAISDAEVRTILAMAHEQALAGDSNAVGSASNLYAGKKKAAAKKVITQEDRIAKVEQMMKRSAADRLDPDKFQQGVTDMLKTGLQAREFKYWMGLMSPKKFADRFLALGGLRLLDTNDMIEYAATLLGADHPAIQLMNETVKAVGRLNGTRVAVRTRMGKIIEDLRKFTEANPKGADDLSYSTDYNSRFNIDAGLFKSGMSEQDAVKTDAVWKFYADKLADPNLTDKDRKKYTKQQDQRAVEVIAGFRAWNQLGKTKGGQEMYMRLRDMHRELYDQRYLLTQKYMEDLKDAGASDAAIKRMVLDLRQQHDLLHDKVNAPTKKEDAHETYPEVPLGLFHREYFPRRRYGDYWLRIRKTGFGEPVLMFFESAAERDAELENWAGELGKSKDDSAVFAYGYDVKKELSDFDTPSKNSVLYRVMENIGKLDPKEFTQEKKDRLLGDVYQLSLLASPEGTIRKQFIKSKKRLGASRDTLRVTADTIEEYATDLARLRHRNEIDKGLLGLKKLTDPKGKGVLSEEETEEGEKEATLETASRLQTIRAFYTSMEDRVQSEYKPSTDNVAAKIVAGANQLAYISFLTSAATAVTQVTGIPMRVAPYLWGRYGMVETTKALARYMNIFKAAPKLEDDGKGKAKTFRILTMRESNFVKNSPRHKAALAAADRDYGLITPMSSFSMRRERTPATAAGFKRERGWKMFYDGMTYMLDTADQLSREAAFMVAYDLEYDKLAKDKSISPEDRQKKAIDRAAKSVTDTLGNFNSIYRPPIMKGSELKKALFLFKYYSLITTAFFFRAGRAMARGVAAINSPDKKTEREEAVAYTKELTGTLAAGFVFGGFTAMPLYTLGMAALQALQDGTDDDDDRRERMRKNPLTADSVEAQFIYEWLPNHFGSPAFTGMDGKQHSLANVLLNGPATEFSGWNLGSRVSLDLTGLWFRSPRDADTWAGLINNALVENIPGASASLNIAAMGEQFAKGNVVDAIKLGMPAQIKAAAKAYDFATEGARTGNEKIRVAKEDFSNSEIIGAALGYNPAQVAKVQRLSRTVTDRTKELDTQKNELLSDVKLAARRLRNGDPGAREELDAAFAEIRDYNDKIGNTAYAIQPQSVAAAIMGSMKDEMFDMYGMGLDLKEALAVRGGEMKPQ